MTRPTGKPRGRPKTQFYTTLMARVPDDLAERARRYAGLKRQTISDVLRDGLLVLLQEDDPCRQFASDRKGDSVIKSDTKGEEQSAPPLIMSDIIGPTSSILSDTKEDSPAITSEVNTVVPMVSDIKEDQPAIVSDTIPAFDHSKYVLGKLCPRGHDYEGTGQTLLRLPGYRCLPCEAARKREKRASQRQPQPA